MLLLPVWVSLSTDSRRLIIKNPSSDTVASMPDLIAKLLCMLREIQIAITLQLPLELPAHLFHAFCITKKTPETPQSLLFPLTSITLNNSSLLYRISLHQLVLYIHSYLQQHHPNLLIPSTHLLTNLTSTLSSIDSAPFPVGEATTSSLSQKAFLQPSPSTYRHPRPSSLSLHFEKSSPPIESSDEDDVLNDETTLSPQVEAILPKDPKQKKSALPSLHTAIERPSSSSKSQKRKRSLKTEKATSIPRKKAKISPLLPSTSHTEAPAHPPIFQLFLNKLILIRSSYSFSFTPVPYANIETHISQELTRIKHLITHNPHFCYIEAHKKTPAITLLEKKALSLKILLNYTQNLIKQVQSLLTQQAWKGPKSLLTELQQFTSTITKKLEALALSDIPESPAPLLILKPFAEASKTTHLFGSLQISPHHKKIIVTSRQQIPWPSKMHLFLEQVLQGTKFSRYSCTQNIPEIIPSESSVKSDLLKALFALVKRNQYYFPMNINCSKHKKLQLSIEHTLSTLNSLYWQAIEQPTSVADALTSETLELVRPLHPHLGALAASLQPPQPIILNPSLKLISIIVKRIPTNAVWIKEVDFQPQSVLNNQLRNLQRSFLRQKKYFKEYLKKSCVNAVFKCDLFKKTHKNKITLSRNELLVVLQKILKENKARYIAYFLNKPWESQSKNDQNVNRNIRKLIRKIQSILNNYRTQISPPPPVSTDIFSDEEDSSDNEASDLLSSNENDLE